MTRINAWSIIAASLAVAPAVASAAITPLDSSSFGKQYNMNNVGEGVDPNNSTSDFFFGVGGATASLSGGFLDYNSLGSAGNGIYWQSQNSNWPASASQAVGWTWEWRIHIDNSDGDVSGRDAAAAVILDDGVKLAYLNVGLAGTFYSNDTASFTTIDSNDNTDDYHTFRIAKEGGTSVFQIWRDGVQVGTNLPTSDTLGIGYQWFGDGSGSFSGQASIDYVRWDTTGAFSPLVPEPASLALLAVGGAMMFRRRRLRA